MIVEVQTDKSVVEIRATGSGLIHEVNAENGQTVKIHETLCSIDTSKKPPQATTVQIQDSTTETKKVASKINISQPEDAMIEAKKVPETKVVIQQAKSEPGTKILEEFNDHPISTLRKLVNDNIKDIHSEKAILSTFNEVRLILNIIV